MMFERTLSLQEMIDFVNSFSANDLHDTYIEIIENNKISREISCLSGIKLIECKERIKLKSKISKQYVSFQKDEIDKIVYSIISTQAGVAELQVYGKKKIACLVVMTDLIDYCPIFGDKE